MYDVQCFRVSATHACVHSFVFFSYFQMLLLKTTQDLRISGNDSGETVCAIPEKWLILFFACVTKTTTRTHSWSLRENLIFSHVFPHTRLLRTHTPRIYTYTGRFTKISLTHIENTLDVVICPWHTLYVVSKLYYYSTFDLPGRNQRRVVEGADDDRNSQKWHSAGRHNDDVAIVWPCLLGMEPKDAWVYLTRQRQRRRRWPPARGACDVIIELCLVTTCCFFFPRPVPISIDVPTGHVL